MSEKHGATTTDPQRRGAAEFGGDPRAAAALRDARALVASTPAELYIDGSFVPAREQATFAVCDPASGETLREVADAGPADGARALSAASASAGHWAQVAPRERGSLLLRIEASIHEHADELSMLIALEMGKSKPEAVAEVHYSADFFRWFAEQATSIDGVTRIGPHGRQRIFTFRRPVGPCLLITPWNFPLAMAARKLAPALASGCTSVLKPAPETPLTALALCGILDQVGIPQGVVNVIPTSDAPGMVAPLLDDPRLRKLSFTGSTEVGSCLLAQSAGAVLRASLELGGNAPFVVFEDADIEIAVDAAVTAKMRNTGQSCIAANRFLVAEEVVDDFTRLFVNRLAGIRVGHGLDPATDTGPLIDAGAVQRVHALVEEARRQGAEVLLGGVPELGRGSFYPPTILAGVRPDTGIMGTEIFGPVAPIAAFADEREAIAAANATQHGLVAYIHTSDWQRAFRVAEKLEVGMVGLNRGIVSEPAAPFGGMKRSGLGREGGIEGLEEYTELSYLSMDR